MVLGWLSTFRHNLAPPKPHNRTMTMVANTSAAATLLSMAFDVLGTPSLRAEEDDSASEATTVWSYAEDDYAELNDDRFWEDYAGAAIVVDGGADEDATDTDAAEADTKSNATGLRWADVEAAKQEFTPAYTVPADSDGKLAPLWESWLSNATTVAVTSAATPKIHRSPEAGSPTSETSRSELFHRLRNCLSLEEASDDDDSTAFASPKAGKRDLADQCRWPRLRTELAASKSSTNSHVLRQAAELQATAVLSAEHGHESDDSQ